MMGWRMYSVTVMLVKTSPEDIMEISHHVTHDKIVNFKKDTMNSTVPNYGEI